MKANPLLVAAVVLALLGGAVWYTRENPPPDSDPVPKIVELEEDAVRKVTLRSEGGDPVELVRDGDGAWEFGGGLEIPADDSSVDALVSSLSSLNAERVVSEAVVDWEPYQLEAPALAVSFELEEGGGEVQFGRDTPTGSGVFARLAGDPRLFTVYTYNKTPFEKSVFDLRDKRMLQVDEGTITEISIRTPSRTIRFARQDSDWRMVEPLDTRADSFTVGDLSRAVRTAEMTEVLAEGDGAEGYSFARPLATVTVMDAGGSHELVVASRGDTHYARSSYQEGVYGISSTLSESFDKDIADYRDKKLFGFGYDDPARVEVRVGDDSVVIVRADGQWQLESDAGRELEGEPVQTLLDRLRGLTATEIPSDSASAQARYGLDAPAIEAAVTPAGEGASTERVRVSSPDQTAVYASRAGEPSTFQVEQAAAQNIARSVEEILREPDEGEGSDDGSDGEEAGGA